MKAECRWMIWRRSTNRNGVSLSYKDEIQINHVQLDRYKIEEREMQKTRLKYVYFYFYLYINLKQKYLNKTLSFNPIIILILTLLTPPTSNYSVLTKWKQSSKTRHFNRFQCNTHLFWFCVIDLWINRLYILTFFSADRLTIYSSDSDDSYSDGEKSGRLMKAKRGGSDEVGVTVTNGYHIQHSAQ